MNKDIFQGNWKQMKGQVQKWWGQLTDDDMDQIAGDSEKLIGKLQEKYGWSKERATQEVNQRMGQSSGMV